MKFINSIKLITVASSTLFLTGCIILQEELSDYIVPDEYFFHNDYNNHSNYFYNTHTDKNNKSNNKNKKYQRFHITPESNNKLCVESRKNKLVLADCNDNRSQIATINPKGQIEISKGYCLEASNRSIITNKCNLNNLKQIWKYSDKSISNIGTNKCLDVAGGIIKSGTEVINYDCKKGQKNQKFVFNELLNNKEIRLTQLEHELICVTLNKKGTLNLAICQNNYYQTFNVNPYNQLEVSDEICLEARGNNVIANKCDINNYRQSWYKKGNSIYNVGENKCLDVTNDIMWQDQKVFLNSCDIKKSNQKFVIK